MILPTDTIWKAGIDKGMLARKVKNLIPPGDTDTPARTGSPPAKLPSSSQPPPSTPSSWDRILATSSGCWYYAHDGKKIGPFSGRKLKELATTGRILPTDTVWSEGTEWGVMARKVKNLFPPGEADESSVSASSPPAKVPSFSQPATTPSNLPPSLLVGDTELKPQAKAPALNSREISQQKQVRQLRAVGRNGVVIISQDGTNVKYKKKCTTCGCVDGFVNRMRIRHGTAAIEFFCPKCRKIRRLEIHGY